MPEGEISIDDPRAADVRALLERHLAFANLHSPPEDVHALDVAGLLDPAITFYSFRLNGELLAVGRAMLDHLLGVARERGFRRVSLETGSMAAFAPARDMYTKAGFTECAPFGDYFVSPNSTCMTLSLEGKTYAGPSGLPQTR
jgi:putative acetyltransferase